MNPHPASCPGIDRPCRRSVIDVPLTAHADSTAREENRHAARRTEPEDRPSIERIGRNRTEAVGGVQSRKLNPLQNWAGTEVGGQRFGGRLKSRRSRE